AELYTYVPGAPLGSQCVLGAECDSGSCADGVCCNTACNAGPCDACSVAAGAAADGTCSLLTGPACDDGDACTQSDICQAGVCTGAKPVVCPARDACHTPGTCDPMKGMCTSPVEPDGSPCPGGICMAGSCVPQGASSVSSGSGSGGGGGAGGAGDSSGSGGGG